MISRADVLAARARTRGYLRRTPLLPPTAATEPWLKCEFLQYAGVSKTRGAFNRQLAARERGELDPSVGIVVASGGNAGLANAYAAGVLGVPATVFVPETAPEVIAAEFGAAAAFAALTSGAYTPAPGERVAVVVCGANTDVRTLEPEA